MCGNGGWDIFLVMTINGTIFQGRGLQFELLYKAIADQHSSLKPNPASEPEFTLEFGLRKKIIKNKPIAPYFLTLKRLRLHLSFFWPNPFPGETITTS